MSFHFDATMKNFVQHLDSCNTDKTFVKIGYNNVHGRFEYSTESKSVVKYPVLIETPVKFKSSISYDWEIISSFFLIHDVEAEWINCNFDWGRYNETTRIWSGGIGKVVIFMLSSYQKESCKECSKKTCVAVLKSDIHICRSVSSKSFVVSDTSARQTDHYK